MLLVMHAVLVFGILSARGSGNGSARVMMPVDVVVMSEMWSERGSGSERCLMVAVDLSRTWSAKKDGSVSRNAWVRKSLCVDFCLTMAVELQFFSDDVDLEKERSSQTHCVSFSSCDASRSETSTVSLREAKTTESATAPHTS